jgi:hypothetical protein
VKSNSSQWKNGGTWMEPFSLHEAILSAMYHPYAFVKHGELEIKVSE